MVDQFDDVMLAMGGPSDRLCFQLFVQHQQPTNASTAHLVITNVHTHDNLFAGKISFDIPQQIQLLQQTTTDNKKSKKAAKNEPVITTHVQPTVEPDHLFLLTVSKHPNSLVKHILPRHTLVLITSNARSCIKMFQLQQFSDEHLIQLQHMLDLSLPNDKGFATHVNVSDEGRFVAVCFSGGDVQLYEVFEEVRPTTTPPAQPPPSQQISPVKPNSRQAVQKQQQSKPSTPIQPTTTTTEPTPPSQQQQASIIKSRLLFNASKPDHLPTVIRAETRFIFNLALIREALDINTIYKLCDEHKLVKQEYNQQLMVCWYGATCVHLYRLKKDHHIKQEWILPSPLTAFAMSTNTEYVCIGLKNGNVMLWDTQSGMCNLC